MGGNEKGWLQHRAERAVKCADGPGNRRAAASRLTAGDGRNLAAQGRRRAGAGHCGGPGRPLDPSPELVAGPGTVPRPAPPHSVPRWGSALSIRGSGPARSFPGSDPASPRPGCPSPRAVPFSGRRRSANRRPPYLSRAADRQAGGWEGRVNTGRGARGRGEHGTDVP